MRSRKQNQTRTDQSFCLKRKIQLCSHHSCANWAAIVKWPLTAVLSIRRHAAKAKTWAASADILIVSGLFPPKLYSLENIRLGPEVVFCSLCASTSALGGWFCYLKKLWSGEEEFCIYFPNTGCNSRDGVLTSELVTSWDCVSMVCSQKDIPPL